jgi:hypothetical protein
LAKTAIHYVFKPQLGAWLKLFTTLLGRVPPDYHAWIIADEVPAFARFDGPLYTTGPIWRIELASPRWPARIPSVATSTSCWSSRSRSC